MHRCEGEKDGVRCHRRVRLITPKGVSSKGFSWTCDPCLGGQKPFQPRSSERKGQQKQAAARKKK